jgi:glycosyltransferase involved in cell wall biosynthesis
LVEKLKLTDRVDFKGFVDPYEKKQIFKNSAFLVLPSHTEGLSMVGLESVMHSTPVLTTKKCNFDEVEQYNAGMVMETNDPETIKEYILKMFAADIKKMSKNAYQLANEKYSIKSVANMMLKELKKIS